MKCSRLTLFDRKEKLSKDGKHNCNYQREYNPQLQNYLPWLNKPRSIHEDGRPYLTVCNLVFANHVQPNRGALSDRWVKKRPRLQSAKHKPPPQPVEMSDDEDEHVDDATETDSQLMEIQQVMQEYEIDENVQRLIQEAAEYDQKTAETAEIEKHNADKRKPKKTKEKARLTRTLSLSRPPSPETIQVIRVDVTSNYSMEEVQIESDVVDADAEEEAVKQEKNCNSRRLYGAKSLIKQPSARELILQCQKLALADRRACSALDAK